MMLLNYQPRRPLARFIERFWICADQPARARERILPSGTIELVFNLRDDEIRTYDSAKPECARRNSGAVISGPYRRSFLIDPAQHALIMGVHFRPGGASPVLGAPADDFTDRHVDLASLWGVAGASLRERLCETATPAGKFAILEQALLSRVRPAAKGRAAAIAALAEFDRTGGEAKCSATAALTGLSPRRFIAGFTREVGVTPKLYCRMLRFGRARAIAEKAATPEWARIAAECGYFDQSHLIRDFQDFGGVSPTQYLRGRGDGLLPNHLTHR
jgi:AraC-like DNA-binding protein